MRELASNLLKRVSSAASRIPEPYRRHIPAFALIGGFVWDLLTLGRPDQVYGNLILLMHLILAGGSILLLNVRKSRGEEQLTLTLTAVMQFSFGSLASALLLFYGQSGTLAGNWLFLALFGVFLVGNEVIRHRYSLALFHIGVYYLLLFAYLGLILPVLLDRMGAGVFLASGAVSLLLIAGFMALLYTHAAELIRTNMRSIVLTIGLIFVAMNGLYFLNLIPPVPLALREIGVFHRVERKADAYEVLYEKDIRPFFERLLPWAPHALHYVPNQSAYCFSSVFAPAGLSVPIQHRWEHFNESTGLWRTEALISFPIRGGRAEGYRGFTIKRITEPGLWRCDVETADRVLIGRISFRTVEATSTPELLAGER